MTRERFAAVMATLSVLPGKDVSAPLLEVYWRVLGDLTDAEMETGATKALRTCRFLPTPSELLELARPRNLPAEAGRVFEDVKRLADYDGKTGELWREVSVRCALGNEVADAFQACGGSNAFKNGDPVWTRKAFVEAYCKHPPIEAPPMLPEYGKELRRLAKGPEPEDRRFLALVKQTGKSLREVKDFRAAQANDDPEAA